MHIYSAFNSIKPNAFSRLLFFDVYILLRKQLYFGPCDSKTPPSFLSVEPFPLGLKLSFSCPVANPPESCTKYWFFPLWFLGSERVRTGLKIIVTLYIHRFLYLRAKAPARPEPAPVKRSKGWILLRAPGVVSVSCMGWMGTALL